VIHASDGQACRRRVYDYTVSSSASPRVKASSSVHSRRAAYLLLVLLALVWGAHWVVVKTGLHYMPPLTYGVLRLVGGLLTVVAILGAQRRLRLPPRSDLPIVLSTGTLQVAAGIVLMNFALQAVPAGRSSVLTFSTPLWVALILWLFFRKRLGAAEILGLGLGIAGILVLVNPTVINWGIPLEVAGTLGLILMAMLWAVVTLHIRRHVWGLTTFDLQPWILLTALVPVGIAALLLERGRSIDWNPVTVLILLYSGPLATAFANWASQSITRSLGPIGATTGFLATPVVGLICGSVFLHETLGPIDLLGFGLVLGGIAATSLIAPSTSQAAPASGKPPQATGPV
jgi:drug/metabolite transporter (DMT)-like permease